MKTLYLHGVGSKLSQEKRAILEIFGDVSAPDLDYYYNPETIESILNTYEKERLRGRDWEQHWRFRCILCFYGIKQACLIIQSGFKKAFR